MTFSGRRPKERDFFVRIVLPECFRSHFVYCFRCLPHQVVCTLKVDHRGSRSAVCVNNKDSPD